MTTYNLDAPLMKLGGEESHVRNWTIRNAFEGVQIFGGIGSGKTSGSGRLLALKYLSMGFGGLVLTVKPDEKELWEEYCRLTGRSDDLIVVEPKAKNYFNFLDFESRDNGTENIVHILKTVIQASNQIDGARGDDKFWDTALDMLIFNIVDLCRLADGKVTVQRMFDLVQALPEAARALRSKGSEPNVFVEAFERAKNRAQAETDRWLREKGKALQPYGKVNQDVLNEVFEEVEEARTYRFIDQFFLGQYINLNEKTRSIIDFSFSGFLFRLLRDPVYSLFCSHESTFSPQECRRGKIILLNLPVKVFYKIGRDCQIFFKLIWQRAMERGIHEESRPVFLWADEAQNFLHEHDATFQATARSSGIATVYISQNLPNYLACMGGTKPEFRVQGFLGTLGTKIFHANADTETNRYASELIGDTEFIENSVNRTKSERFSFGQNLNFKIDRAVRPEQFASLATGGPENDFKAGAYMHVQGRPLTGESNFIKLSFNQNFIINPQNS